MSDSIPIHRSAPKAIPLPDNCNTETRCGALGKLFQSRKIFHVCLHNRNGVVELFGKMCTDARVTMEFLGEKREMKTKTLISASLLLAFAGCSCGQSSRPSFFAKLNQRLHGAGNVGEPCDAGCQVAHMQQPAAGGCESCATNSMNYGGYEGPIVDSYEGTPVGMPSGSYSTQPPTYSTPYSTTTPYSSAGQPSGVRAGTESILPKAAN